MGEGERLYAAQRKRFWRILGGLLLLGFVTGIVGGLAHQMSDTGPSSWPAWVSLAGSVGVVIVVIGLAYGSWLFFVSVDEVEVADNLWGSMIGFYVYAILFPAWSALNWLDQVPKPDHWAIFVISMAAALAVYGYRKWQSR